MAINHTRGPWAIMGSRSPVWIIGGNGVVLGNVYLTDPATQKRTPEYEGNAALFAEAPAMLAALRKAADALEGDIFTDAEECGASVANARAVHGELRAALARIDGAAPAPTAPAPVSAPGFAAHALDTLKDCEAWFANGGDVDGVFFDDATMLDRVRESLALATPTAQPAGAIGEAGGGVRGLLFDIRDFLAGFEDCEDNGELVQGLQERIARATEGEA